MDFEDIMNDAEFAFHYNEYRAWAYEYEEETPEQLEAEAAERYAEGLIEDMDAMEARGGPRFDIYGSHDEIPFLGGDHERDIQILGRHQHRVAR